MIQPDYASAILGSDLPKKEQLASLVRPAVIATPGKGAAKAPVGQTRLGGKPDMPEEFDWPIWNDTPLSFIAQLNLAELPEIAGRELLPKTGLLSFFYCVGDGSEIVEGHSQEEKEAFVVYYHDLPAGDLARTGFPAELKELDGGEGMCIFKAHTLDFQLRHTFPGYDHPALERLGVGAFTKNGERLDEVLGAVPGHRDELSQQFCQILGHPTPVQNDVLWNAEEGSGSASSRNKDARRASEEWELLLQVDSFSDLNGMMWGDLGRLYYLLKREDIKAGQWDKHWLVMQCG